MKGYNKIASLMSSYPESAIVARFSELNIQNIIYLRAEIFGLQQDLRDLEDANDRSPNTDRAKFSTDCGWVGRAMEIGIGIREKLREYNEAVFLWTQMSKSSSPHPKRLAKFQEWMRRPSMGSVFLIGRDRNVWADGKDLVAIQENAPDSMFFEIWANTITLIYHYTIRRFYKKPDIDATDYAPNIVDYSDTAIFRIASFFCVIMASILPVLTIVVLYLVASMVKHLALFGTFTTISSVCLWFMTDGRLVEVFSANPAR
ncbi:hypothetical protein BOTCAL_0050g00150 [Botryotinia calthae]|uniref:DUF6594 domain-containing protein n=1 Tax=Botryotinia calthae TaxID=38488 RepID=A0A4Y8DAZ7_9HELO|nr:hypothetical protein BOTCAL_0050g00150 [Botryotinia calthae]